jgi:hypothetical protein
VRKRAKHWLKWYYFTRGLGATMVVYELFFVNGTAERGTIILAGCGMAGYDFVSRKDKGTGGGDT